MSDDLVKRVGPNMAETIRSTTEDILYSIADINPNTEHGKGTAMRFLQSLMELTSCVHSHDAMTCTKWKTFPAPSQDMIVVQDIPFSSLCNHHVLPFMGFVHVAYVPDKLIAGLSKFKRAVDHFAKRPQVQEDLTAQIGDFLEHHLQPKGVGVIVQAEHLCMSIRGAQAPGALTTTNTMRGVFSDHSRTAKAEFTAMINGRRR